MGLIDRALAAVSPRMAYQREAWRQAHEEIKRNYDAGRLDRLNSGWRSIFNQSGEATDTGSRDIVRARARDLERNSDVMGAVLTAIERNVVKDGINLQAKTQDEDLNEQIEALWKEWCKPRNCDVSGEQSFTEILRTTLRRKYVDGGFFLIKVYTGTLVPFQVQLLEVDELDIAQLQPKTKGNTVVAGIEVSPQRKVEGYWFRRYSADGLSQLEAQYIPAQQVIFYKHKTRPSQVREMSPMANMLTRIRDIDSYMEAVGVKERINACLAVFITKANPSSGTFGRGTRQTDPSSGYKGKSLTPGMIEELEPGDDVRPVTPAGQGGSASDYVRLVQRMAGAGIGLSYESASRDMSQVNYSSARQGLIEDEGTYSMEQQQLVDHVLREVYTEFVISAVLAGQLVVPDFWQKKKEYLQHIWIMPGRKWIDPVKEANANKTALATGQLTLAQIIGSQGRDWKEQIDEIAAITAYANEKGVKLFDEKQTG